MYVSDIGLHPETIVSKIGSILDDRLSHSFDSHEGIGAIRWSQDKRKPRLRIA